MGAAPYVMHMETGLTQGPFTVSNQASVEQERRVREEARLIAEGRAQLKAGLGIPLDDLEAWLLLRETDPTAPLPNGRALGSIR